MGGSSSRALPYELERLDGKVYVVTGANTGLGLATCKVIAEQGALVVLACRSQEKGEAALEEVKKYGKAELRLLDLTDLDSVDRFAKEMQEAHSHIDCLLNNAGVMFVPQGKTKQGFETTIGTNHLGPFALTMKLLPMLKSAPEARVVGIGSIAATWSRSVDWEDYQQHNRKYSPIELYGTSKLFNLLFTFQLQKKLEAAGVRNVIAVAAHPGWTTTDIMRHHAVYTLGKLLSPSMRPEDGCKPQVLVAAGKNVKAGDYYGPSGWWEVAGPPGSACPPALALDEPTQQRLWEESEKLTNVSFPF